jgi:hypothetical protein
MLGKGGQMSEEEQVEVEERQRQKALGKYPSPRAGLANTPGSFVRLGHEMAGIRRRRRVYVGKALWYGVGRPARLDVQRQEGKLCLVPVSGKAGYAVAVSTGMPRFFAASAADLLEPLADGRYAAEVQGGRIVIGGRLDRAE